MLSLILAVSWPFFSLSLRFFFVLLLKQQVRLLRLTLVQIERESAQEWREGRRGQKYDQKDQAPPYTRHYSPHQLNNFFHHTTWWDIPKRPSGGAPVFAPGFLKIFLSLSVKKTRRRERICAEPPLSAAFETMFWDSKNVLIYTSLRLICQI